MVRRVRRGSASADGAVSGSVPLLAQMPQFAVEKRVEISVGFPIGGYHVQIYVRGRVGEIAVIEPPTINNEEEGFGRIAGSTRFTYRVATKSIKTWPAFAGRSLDELRLEIFEHRLRQA